MIFTKWLTSGWLLCFLKIIIFTILVFSVGSRSLWKTAFGSIGLCNFIKLSAFPLFKEAFHIHYVSFSLVSVYFWFQTLLKLKGFSLSLSFSLSPSLCLTHTYIYMIRNKNGDGRLWKLVSFVERLKTLYIYMWVHIICLHKGLQVVTWEDNPGNPLHDVCIISAVLTLAWHVYMWYCNLW